MAVQTPALRKGVVVTPADFNGVDWLAEMSRLGLNTLGMHSGGGAGVDVLKRLGTYVEDDFRSRAAEHGIDVEYELHAGASLLPRDRFDAAPAMYIMDRHGRRLHEHNWCPSSPEASRLVAANARELGRLLKPDTHRYFFWGDDARGWCHCESCRSWTDADQELLAANTLAAALKAADPSATAAFLCYANTLQCPREVAPADDVFAEFAPVHRCYRHAIDDARCAVNRGCWQVLLDVTGLFTPTRVHVLEYWLDSSMFSGWKKPAKRPLFDRDVVRRDLRAYYGLGIRSITTFAVYMDGEYVARHGNRELDEYAELLGELG